VTSPPDPPGEGAEHRPLVALVGDGRALDRAAIARALDGQPDISVVATPDTPGDAATAVARHRPDVVVIAHEATHTAAEMAAACLRQQPDLCVLVAGVEPDVGSLVSLARLGVHGFVTADASVEDVSAAIRSVAAGNFVIPDDLSRRLLAEISRQEQSAALLGQRLARLTPQQRRILDALAQGMSNDAIAARFGVRPVTVRTHVQNLLKRLGVHSRLEAVALVLAGDQVEADPPV
jgi:two-component system, NarL family, nitrate/nitrite response regulator NarL